MNLRWKIDHKPPVSLHPQTPSKITVKKSVKGINPQRYEELEKKIAVARHEPPHPAYLFRFSLIFFPHNFVIFT